MMMEPMRLVQHVTSVAPLASLQKQTVKPVHKIELMLRDVHVQVEPTK